VGKKEINVWEKLFTVIDIFCRILVLVNHGSAVVKTMARQVLRIKGIFLPLTD